MGLKKTALKIALSAWARAPHQVIAAVLECVHSLSNAGFQQVQTAVRNVGAVPCLIQLMNHEQTRISGTAATLVSTLCPSDVQTAEQLFESGGLVMLAERLSTAGDERSQLQAARPTCAHTA